VPSTLESGMEMASRHVVSADMICSRQIELIQWMTARGMDTAAAENLLRLFFHIFALHHARLKALTRRI
jgi:hypothetical protein